MRCKTPNNVASRSTPPLSARLQRRAQRGVTMFGLLTWSLLIGFGGYILVRTLPTVNEYFTIQRTVEKVAAQNLSTVAEVRAAFDRQKEIEYAIVSVTGRDLSITKENDKVVIGYAYNKEVPVLGPVYILLKYEGRSK
ncbi:MAG: DUF4845 domain-containing protein [Rubrivivax sp.]|jgi:hypothetical protein